MDEKQSENHSDTDSTRSISKSSNKLIIVRRRLDRTPDKSFRKLKDKEKITITTLRTALEEAKFRTDKLKDENEFK